jgi:hypothetical protein
MISVRYKGLAEDLGVYNQDISDTTVADKILENITGIYSWILVKTHEYQFPGTSTVKKARVITVRPNSWESLCHLITLLWTQKGPVHKISIT